MLARPLRRIFRRCRRLLQPRVPQSQRSRQRMLYLPDPCVGSSADAGVCCSLGCPSRNVHANECYTCQTPVSDLPPMPAFAAASGAPVATFTPTNAILARPLCRIFRRCRRLLQPRVPQSQRSRQRMLYLPDPCVGSSADAGVCCSLGCPSRNVHANECYTCQTPVSDLPPMPAFAAASGAPVALIAR